MSILQISNYDFTAKLNLTISLKNVIFPAMSYPSLEHQKYLQEELDRARKELSILYNVSNAMRTTLELNHILYIILTGVTANTGLGFNRAILFLVNKKERCLEGKMVIGPDSEEHAEQIWKYLNETKHNLEDLITADKISQQTTQSKLFKILGKSFGYSKFSSISN